MEKPQSLGQRIREGFRDTFWVWRQELNFIFKDSVVVLFFLIVPLAYPIIYTLIYNTERASEAPLAVVDDSNTAFSREFIRRIDASPEVKVVAHCPDMPHAQEWLYKQYAYGILYIPHDFSEAVNRNQQTHASLYCDMSSLLFYKAFVLTATEVSLDMGAELQMETEKHATAQQDFVAAHPVQSASISLYNPQSGFASFLIPAVLMLLIQQTLLIGICMLAGTARERNQFDTLIPVANHYNGVFRIVFGKSLLYFMLYALASFWLLLVMPKLFSLPRLSNPIDLLMFGLPYILACIFFAITLSCFVKDRESPMILFVFTSVIFIFLTGVSWPTDAMPVFWRYVSYLIPSTHGVQGFVKMNCMGATLNQVQFEYQALWLQMGFYFTTAVACYHLRFRQTHERHLFKHLQKLQDRLQTKLQTKLAELPQKSKSKKVKTIRKTRAKSKTSTKTTRKKTEEE
jgi:ABC-2 type transport system permease protein